MIYLRIKNTKRLISKDKQSLHCNYLVGSRFRGNDAEGSKRVKISSAIFIFLKALIYFYRYAISPWLRPRCRFLPTCSEYALDALKYHGPYKGGLLALKRICRCHPWGDSGFDPVKKDK